MNNMNNGNLPLMPMSPSMANQQMMQQPLMNGNMGNMGNQQMMQQPAMNGNMGNIQQGQQSGSVVDSLFATQLTGSPTGASIREIKKSENYYDSPKSPTRQYNKHHERQFNSDKDEIRKLARNINKSLDDFEPSKAHTDDEDIVEKYNDEKDDEKNDTNDKNNEDYSILSIGKEMILIIIIYVILSQGFVRRSIANYVPQLNPNTDGVIPFTGYVIYGSLLAILFVFFRYFVVK